MLLPASAVGVTDASATLQILEELVSATYFAPIDTRMLPTCLATR